MSIFNLDPFRLRFVNLLMVLVQDLLSILNDIREKHFADSTTADAPYTADEVQKKIDEVMKFKRSEREKQLLLVCNQLQIPYSTLKPDEKAALLSAISKSKILGKHGRGKRKHKNRARIILALFLCFKFHLTGAVN